MFDELVQKLRQCHQADHEVGQTFIRVLPSGPKGFPVMIEWVWGAHFTVFLDGWHQDFDTYQEAVRCLRSPSRATTGLRLGARAASAFVGRLSIGTAPTG